MHVRVRGKHPAPSLLVKYFDICIIFGCLLGPEKLAIPCRQHQAHDSEYKDREEKKWHHKVPPDGIGERAYGEPSKAEHVVVAVVALAFALLCEGCCLTHAAATAAI